MSEKLNWKDYFSAIVEKLIGFLSREFIGFFVVSVLLIWGCILLFGMEEPGSHMALFEVVAGLWKLAFTLFIGSRVILKSDKLIELIIGLLKKAK